MNTDAVDIANYILTLYTINKSVINPKSLTNQALPIGLHHEAWFNYILNFNNVKYYYGNADDGNYVAKCSINYAPHYIEFEAHL